MPETKRQCDNCGCRSNVSCVTCNRSMCEGCISYGNAGKVCGLCKDREDGRKRYDRLQAGGSNLDDFDEWYDANA